VPNHTQPPASSRVALITGGTHGIGRATARKLATLGFQLVIASRDAQAGSRAVAAIRTAVPGAQVEWMPLDLASFASVRQFAQAFHARGTPLHVLINNAGGTNPGKQARFSPDGFELTFATNHLGHFLLTQLLLDDLRRAQPSRMIAVSSQQHIPGYAGGPGARFDYDNLKAEKCYDVRVFYANAKLANVWFAYELQRRYSNEGITGNAVCPGFVPEAIAERRRGLTSWMYKNVLARMPFARSLEQASSSIAYLATDPRYETTGGKFIFDAKEIRSSDESYDEDKARLLWERSLQWCGLLNL
jgi:NAD(P)-dependent dehydrogenase (short-subunit alcohol dehydrogenase family)